MTTTCNDCGEEIDAHRDSGHFQFASGFIPLRARGTNQLKLLRRKNLFICKSCMDVRGIGMIPGQQPGRQTTISWLDEDLEKKGLKP